MKTFDYRFCCGYCCEGIVLRLSVELGKYQIVSGCSKVNAPIVTRDLESNISKIKKLIDSRVGFK